ncbi:MAG: hypothetical protein Q9181_006467 [Wetmoreana brouardii]
MYSNVGSPAFKQDIGATAEAGSYEIDTTNDFTTNLNFLAGLAAPDANGRMVPVGSFAARPNSKTQISPNVNFYVSAFATGQVTAIDWKSESETAAQVLFSDNRGKYGATVESLSDGTFTVDYTSSRAEHLYLVQKKEQSGSPLEQKGIFFLGNLTWLGANGDQVEAIVSHMENGMTAGLYEVKAPNYNGSKFGLLFKANTITTLNTVNNYWESVYNTLSDDLKKVSRNENCEVQIQSNINGELELEQDQNSPKVANKEISVSA